MKYLFINLTIRDGERVYEYRCLTSTKCKNIYFAAEWYASHFWGFSKREKDFWKACNDEITIKVSKVKELTFPEFKYLNELF